MDRSQAVMKIQSMTTVADATDDKVVRFDNMEGDNLVSCDGGATPFDGMNGTNQVMRRPPAGGAWRRSNRSPCGALPGVAQFRAARAGFARLNRK